MWGTTPLPVVYNSIQSPSPPHPTYQGPPTVILACILTTFSVACTQNVASDAVPIRLCTTTVARGREETSTSGILSVESWHSPVRDQWYLSLVQYLRRPVSFKLQVAPPGHSAQCTLLRLLGAWGHTDWLDRVAQSHWVFQPE